MTTTQPQPLDRAKPEVTADPLWIRSSLCVGGECVQARIAGPYVLVRDTKLVASPVQHWTRDLWTALLDAIRANAVHAAVDRDAGSGTVWLGLDSRYHPTLTFTADEWATFEAAVRDGEFNLDTMDGPQPPPSPDETSHPPATTSNAPKVSDS